MYHSSAVVGLNTSAMIEAAILGRPVLTVLLPEFHGSQEGTVHFHYLLKGPDALLRTTRSLEDHARELASAVDGQDPDPQRSARFIRTFVRPEPVELAATTRLVNELESLAAHSAPVPVPTPGWTRLVHPLLKPFARGAIERLMDIKAERTLQKICCSKSIAGGRRRLGKRDSQTSLRRKSLTSVCAIRRGAPVLPLEQELQGGNLLDQ